MNEDIDPRSTVPAQGRVLCRSVCKVRTQDPEKSVEEVKSLVTAWRSINERRCRKSKAPGKTFINAPRDSRTASRNPSKEREKRLRDGWIPVPSCSFIY